MLCGGITTYSPLRNNGCGPGKRVGVIGVGGLGHYAIMFAKAMGADRVVGISRKSNKKEDALQLGADAYIATDEDENWAAENSRSLDLIISTVSSTKVGPPLPPSLTYALYANRIDAPGRLPHPPPHQRDLHPAGCPRGRHHARPRVLAAHEARQVRRFADRKPQ